MFYICSFFEKKDRKNIVQPQPLPHEMHYLPSRGRPTGFKAGYSWMHARTLTLHDSNPRTLAKFDGERILLAIAGTAFDFTAGRGFYGPGERT